MTLFTKTLGTVVVLYILGDAGFASSTVVGPAEEQLSGKSHAKRLPTLNPHAAAVPAPSNTADNINPA